MDNPRLRSGMHSGTDLEDWIHTSYSRILNCCRCAGLVPSEADDIAQEAFLRVWNQASSFDPGLARFTTWLHRIVLNLAIDRMRRPGSEPIEQADDVASDAPSALAHIIAEQEIVSKALLEIPERQRAAIALFHFEGLSGREAAIAMDLSEKAFESLLIRARTALKQRVLAVTRRQQS